MMWLADEYMERGVYPTDIEAINLLTFFGVFSIGCTELKLFELAKVFNHRSFLYISVLNKMGYGWKGSWWFLTQSMLPGPLRRITLAATRRVEYLTQESTRFKTGTRNWLSKLEKERLRIKNATTRSTNGRNCNKKKAGG